MPALTPPSRFARTATSVTLILTLVACSGTPIQPLPTATVPVEEPVQAAPEDPIQALLVRAEQSASPVAESLMLDAIALMLDAGSHTEADQQLDRISGIERLPPNLQARYHLAIATLAIANDEATAALQVLANPLFASEAVERGLQIAARQLRADAYLLSGQFMPAIRERIQLVPALEATARISNNNAVWEILSTAPAATLRSAGNNLDSYELRGWLELFRLVTTNQHDIQNQISTMDQWRNTWAQHSASAQLPDALDLLYDIWSQRPREIGLVLPMQEPVGKAISEGFLSAYYDAIGNGRDAPQVRIYDTSLRTDVLEVYDQAVADGVDMIIGPVLKDAVRRMQGADRPMAVPTLALNYGDIGGTSPEGLYQFGLAPEDEIMQAADSAWEEGYRNAAILTPAGEEYQRIQDTFVSYWTALGGQVVSIDTFGGSGDYSPVIKRIFSIDGSEARAAQIRNLIPRQSIQFVPRRRQDVDFIFLLANPGEGRQIKPTLSFHFAGDVPIYAMPSIYDGSASNSANRELNGVVFNDAPWVLESNDPLKATMTDTWSAASGPIQRLRAMGVDSYRLFLRLEQMRKYPYTRVAGATGMLSMKPDGGIRRELVNATFINGIANVMPR